MTLFFQTEDRLWSGTSGQEDTGSETRETRATCGSMESSRATSRSVEVRLVKLRSDIQHYRSSSVEEAQEEAGDSADPDWEDNEEEDAKDEVGDDDPEYDPEKRERGKKSV